MLVQTKSVDPPKFLSGQALIELYLERPTSLITWCFGTWFCLGTQIKDDTLHTLEMKPGLMYVTNAGYNGISNLESRLASFNEINKD